jgi:hypothetical protein
VHGRCGRHPGPARAPHPGGVALESARAFGGATGGTHLPLAWRFGPAPQTGDRALAKPLLQTMLTDWPEAQRPRVLLMDAGFLDGAWLRTLVDGGLTVVVQLRSDLTLFDLAVQTAAGEPARQWHTVALPARPAGSRVPVQRCGVRCHDRGRLSDGLTD